MLVDENGLDKFIDMIKAYADSKFTPTPPTPQTFTITNTLTNCTTSNQSVSIQENSSYNATITADGGYTLTGATVSITMGGTDITSTAYSNRVISIANVSGNLVISVSAVAEQPAISYTITIDDINGANTGDITINENGTATVAFTPNIGYDLPTYVKVENAEYSYNSDTGVLTLSNPTDDVEIEAFFPLSGCLTFRNIESGRGIYMWNAYGYKSWDGMLEYSEDGINWIEIEDDLDVDSDGGLLYIRGTSNTYLTDSGAGGSYNVWNIESTGSTMGNEGMIECHGNIENLLDYQTVAQGNHPPMAAWCFATIFAQGTQNQLRTAPKLPATTLSEGCYESMFEDCIYLINVPNLPAIKMEPSCYSSMFAGCTSLTTLPENLLPASILAESCYGTMFYGCTNLQTLPKLYGTDLVDGCYSNMFRDCSSIKLSATQTSEYINEYRIPYSDTGTNAANDALTNMFYGTGGTFTGTPTINTTYYTSNEVADSKHLIWFSIPGYDAIYAAEYNSTWYEWAHSEYNIDGYYTSIETWLPEPNKFIWEPYSGGYYITRNYDEIIINATEYHLHDAGNL